MMSLLTGAKEYLNDAAGLVTYEAVANDQEEEIESMMAAADIDEKQQRSSGTYLRQPSESSKRRQLNSDTDIMSKNLKTASQNIVVSNTLSEYRRCAAQCHHAHAELTILCHPGSGSSSNSSAVTLTG